MTPAFIPGPVPRSEVPPDDELVPFSAEIYTIGINPAVDVPAEVSEALGARGLTPVSGLLEETPIRATFVPVGDARHRLYLNTAMREAAGVSEGDTVRVAVALDREPRPTIVPEELRSALEEVDGALEAFEAQTPSRQRDMVVWLEGAKRPETREKRLKRIVEELAKRMPNG